MNRLKSIKYLILITIFSQGSFAQEQPKFPPYTINATYQKLKKDYPFITPIKPLVSNKIKAT
mgnify:CR=1 FL=1